MKKEFQIFIYSKDGEFLKTLNQNEFSGGINFVEKLNHGFQGFSFNYLVKGKTIEDYDQDLIKKMNRVEIVMSSKDHREGKNIYSGYISKLRKTQSGLQKTVKVSCLGIQYLMASNFEFTQLFPAIDPRAMISTVIDDFNTQHPRTQGDSASWVVKSDLQDFGTTATLDLSAESWFKSIVKIRDISDDEWFFRFEPDWGFKFSQRSATSQHQLDITKHISFHDTDDDPEDIENVIEFEYNGGSLTVTDAASIAEFGRRKREKEIDTTISDSTTATRRANTLLVERKDPRVRIVCEVTDSYDLESIRVGDVVEFVGVKEGSFLDQNLLQVAEITYKNGNSLRISFDDYEENLAQEIQKLLN